VSGKVRGYDQRYDQGYDQGSGIVSESGGGGVRAGKVRVVSGLLLPWTCGKPWRGLCPVLAPAVAVPSDGICPLAEATRRYPLPSLLAPMYR
jgi:hypothetical protein